jgi:hypothetical protein
MATYRELLAQVKSEIDEISTIEAHERLESSAADAPRFHFHERLRVLDGLLEQLEGVIAAAFAQQIHRAIENALGGGLLALPHHAVDELLDHSRVVDRIRCYFARFSSSSPTHVFPKTSGALRRISNDPAYGWPPRPHRACRV